MKNDNGYIFMVEAVFKRENGLTWKSNRFELGNSEFEDVEDSHTAFYYRCTPIKLFE